MSSRLVDGSMDDAMEVMAENGKPKNEVEDVNVIRVSPRYKGKHPKTPEELAKIREQKKLNVKKFTNKLYESKDKMVSHPNHYQCGKYEVIDIIEDATRDLTGIFAIDTGHILRYVLRWNKKGDPRQNIEKAMWYCSHLLKALDESTEGGDVGA